MGKILETANGIIWGIPALAAILGVGLFLSVRTGFLQIRLFPKALIHFLNRIRKKEAKTENGVSPYQAFCTALGATVGTGNIAGVAGAIALGGPGAVFWMWISALLGMVTKFAEATLAVYFQDREPSGEVTGGPMHIICKVMGNRWRFMAYAYSFFGVVAAFGVGNSVQINAVVDGVESVVQSFNGEMNIMRRMFVGLVLAVLIAVVLRGGVTGIGRFAEKLVPFAALFYIMLCMGAIAVRWDRIGSVLGMIVSTAFTPKAATGGVVGSFAIAVRIGTSRGVFTNEAGLGTAAIAHGSATVTHPVEQGFMGIMEVFLDTIIICTLTAFVILCSGVPVTYGLDPGVALTSKSFASVYGDWVNVPLTLSLILFAVATVMGWGLYGARCAQFLFGKNVWKHYTWMQAGTAFLGSIVQTGTLWLWAETVNGFMMIPNLIVLICACPLLVKIIRDYERSGKKNQLPCRGE